jgi:hypothetical protein
VPCERRWVDDEIAVRGRHWRAASRPQVRSSRPRRGHRRGWRALGPTASETGDRSSAAVKEHPASLSPERGISCGSYWLPRLARVVHHASASAPRRSSMRCPYPDIASTRAATRTTGGRAAGCGHLGGAGAAEASIDQSLPVEPTPVTPSGATPSGLKRLRGRRHADACGHRQDSGGAGADVRGRANSTLSAVWRSAGDATV